MRRFEPQPSQEEQPDAFPSPFNELEVHPLARRAADALKAELTALDLRAGGKMFGALVVRDPRGQVGFLRAFSGLLEGQWDVEGFVPPLFHRETRAALQPPGEAAIGRLVARAQAHQQSPEWETLRALQGEQEHRHLAEREAQRRNHQERRLRRKEQRDALAAEQTLTGLARTRALEALDNESRRDKAERRRLEAEQRTAHELLKARLEAHQRRARALERLRQYLSRLLMKRLHDTYQVPSAGGEVRPLRSLFAPGEPPSGAGDCCAPKLLAAAYRQGLTPLALAEFWAGPPPGAGGRADGAFYPACQGKCGPLLPFMLKGLEVAPTRRFQVLPLPPVPLRIVYEDRWLVVVEKPEGLLSVPARGDSAADSLLSQLRRRYPAATGPLLVHRLDLDTSGLLLAALDAGTHKTLQRQFLHRQVEKRYVACVAGSLKEQRGVIDLPLRVDLEDRPRQIHDPVHGLKAVTRWEVISTEADHTRVALFPETGRTHQLRAHAAHPRGLHAPILGDRLYGHPGPRLLLHAEGLGFAHPHSGARLSLRSAVPF